MSPESFSMKCPERALSPSTALGVLSLSNGAARGDAMISNGRSFIFDQWWVATMPGFAIIVVSLGFCFLGDGLRDVLDPKSEGKT